MDQTHTTRKADRRTQTSRLNWEVSRPHLDVGCKAGRRTWMLQLNWEVSRLYLDVTLVARLGVGRWRFFLTRLGGVAPTLSLLLN